MPKPDDRVSLTKRTVDAAPVPPEGRETRLWDREVLGFFLRVYPSGRRVYALKYRTVAGRQRIHTLGVHGSPLTPDQARDDAKAALRAASEGKDPADAKREARQALTVAELVELYLTEGPTTKQGKRASTWANDGSNLRRHIVPLLGKSTANGVTREDAQGVHRKIAEGQATRLRQKGRKHGVVAVTGGPGTARRTCITAAAMWAWAMRRKAIAPADGVNPFSRMELPSAPVRERFLSREEAGRLLDALTTLQGAKALSATWADAIRLLLLTGARKSEILGLTWREVDTERNRLTLPPERTKAGGKTGARYITLSPPALLILAGRRPAKAAPDAYVFPAASGDGHAIGLRRAFTKVCQVAQLEGLRVHDLRHSFASFAIADGASLFLVGKLLGHASTRTTERYAHLSADPLADAAAAVGARLMPAAPGPKAENGAASNVISFEQGRG